MPRDRGETPAVRVYTVCDESRYLIVRNVPELGCGDELSKLFGSYGEIEECKPMDAEDCEPFTDIYWIKFSQVSNARFAKRKLDESVFLGNRLQVSYAPQFESLSDTKEKLEGRRKEVLGRIKCRLFILSNTISWHTRYFINNLNSCFPYICISCLILIAAAGKSGGSSSQVSNYLLTETSDQHWPAQAPSVSSSSGLQISSNQSNYSKASQISDKDAMISHVSSNEEYFSSSSMNKTVRLVREKLDKIQSSSEAGPSFKKTKVDNRRRI